MFSWVSGSLERLANTVAPPPDDGASKFVFCCERGDESGAVAAVDELPDITAVVQPLRGRNPIHIACSKSMPILIRQLLSHPGVSNNMSVPDGTGNTPLHCAAMSNASNALDVVKMLVTEYNAPICVTNTAGETAYDVALLSVVRQYLLPIQLQQETQYALDNGGKGLPPGIDLGGLKITNNHLPPPPRSAPPAVGEQMSVWHQPSTGQAMLASPPLPNQVMTTEVATTVTHSSAPRSNELINQPTSSRDYARTGYSSAAVLSGNSKYRPDGFHSSSSDKSLQEKYGHATVSYGRTGSSVSTVPLPPPPSSGGNATIVTSSMTTHSAPPSMGGGNPYAAMGRPTNRRYVAYDPITGRAIAPTPSFPLPSSSGGYIPQQQQQQDSLMSVTTEQSNTDIRPVYSTFQQPTIGTGFYDNKASPRTKQAVEEVFATPTPSSTPQGRDPSIHQGPSHYAVDPNQANPGTVFFTPTSGDQDTIRVVPLSNVSMTAGGAGPLTSNSVVTPATLFSQNARATKISTPEQLGSNMEGSAGSSNTSASALFSRPPGSSTVISSSDVANDFQHTFLPRVDTSDTSDGTGQATYGPIHYDWRQSRTATTIPTPPEDEDQLDDVPLSPDAHHHVRKSAATTATTEESGRVAPIISATSPSSLYDAIGMPPPPYSRK